MSVVNMLDKVLAVYTFVIIILTYFVSFSALTLLLVVRKSIRAVKIE